MGVVGGSAWLGFKVLGHYGWAGLCLQPGEGAPCGLPCWQDSGPLDCRCPGRLASSWTQTPGAGP